MDCTKPIGSYKGITPGSEVTLIEDHHAGIPAAKAIVESLEQDIETRRVYVEVYVPSAERTLTIHVSRMTW